MSEIQIRLWERAEAAIEAIARDVTGEGIVRKMAKAATVAVLRELSEEIEQAEEDEVMWPDSGDLQILADELEES